ncbi:hypothetical protein D3C80_2136580 [compost metagenome]
MDKGSLFAVLSGRWAKLMCLQLILRHKELYRAERSWVDVYKLMCLGILKIRNKSSVKK